MRICIYLCHSNFLVNSADRVIRVFDIEEVLKQPEDEVEALQRLQDLVNRYVCVFGGGGYSVCSGESML